MAALRKCAAKCLATPLTRHHASVSKLVDIVVNDNTGVAIVSMNRGPVNSLNFGLLTELTYGLRELEKSKCRGVILTSSLPTVFSAGLDIFEMYKQDRKRVETFWHALQESWSTLYGTWLPTAAAINGTCAAGGTVLALSCEYRVFVEGKCEMGLNETMVGLVSPKWTQDMMMKTSGHRRTEISMLRGSMYTPEEALKVGLVDELASDKGDAVVKCENYLATYTTTSLEARSTTKLQLRGEALGWLKQNMDLDANTFLDRLEQPEVQKAIGVYIRAIKKKSQTNN